MQPRLDQIMSLEPGGGRSEQENHSHSVEDGSSPLAVGRESDQSGMASFVARTVCQWTEL